MGIFSLLLIACRGGLLSSDVKVNENSVDTVSFEEIIRINNCGNPTESTQTKMRSFSTSIDGAAELGVNYQVIEGSVSGRYGQYRNAATSQELTAAPNTNMEFILRWSEKVHAGNVTVNGKSGTYSVHIPIAVEQVSCRDLKCDGEAQPVTEPTSSADQPQPETINNVKDCSGNTISSFWYASDNILGHNAGAPISTHEWGAVADQSLNFQEVALVFGPYIELAPGNYNVIFTIKANNVIDSKNTIVTRLNIGSNSGQNINPDMANQDIRFSQFVQSGEHQEFHLPFRINYCTDYLEFRVFHKNKATIIVKSIELQPK
jgi:hypothetical protein